MQFKYPEILWALLLLLIPIFIHLFQLRRFKKTPFTNVKVLQRIQSESSKSNTVKKWLLLLTRLLLLSALILAFAQPFKATISALQQKETVIYLDDSFSTQAKNDNVSILENAVQDLIKSIPADEKFSLFTNQRVFKDVKIADIQNDLLALPHTGKQLNIADISLKANTFFSPTSSAEKNLILISDFQNNMAELGMDTISSVKKHWVKLLSKSNENTTVDSIYISQTKSDAVELTAILSTTGKVESTPVSLFNGDKLIAKTSAIFNDDQMAEVKFTLQANEQIKGKIEISDAGLPYDNVLYFTIDEKDKIKVLAVDSGDSNYLKRVFTNAEFEFASYDSKNLDYSQLNLQNLIVLNELENIPNSLLRSLIAFTDQGGNLTVIPAKNIDTDSYNGLLGNLMGSSILQKVNVEKNIAKISFSHPLYENVFEKKVTNFQYPKVAEYYRVRTTLPAALSFQDNAPFLVGNGGKYLFTAAIDKENSNFKESPLIVPTFYNMGINSLKLPELYQVIGNNTTIDIPYLLGKDDILKVKGKNYQFIPQQQSSANKVALNFHENEMPNGIYEITDGEKVLRNISFNNPRDESEMKFMDLNKMKIVNVQNSVEKLFDILQKNNTLNELWKWFVILALLFLLVEIIIQKYL